MGAAAATIEVERLEGLWSAKGGGGDGLRRVMSESGRGEGVSPAGGNKRVAKKAAELAQLVGQPQSNGAEAAAAEVTGRHCHYHFHLLHNHLHLTSSTHPHRSSAKSSR